MTPRTISRATQCFGLSLLAVLAVLAALGPVTAWGASMAVRECPPADPATPSVLPPCKTKREPMTLEQCEVAKAAWLASGSLEATVAESGLREGYTIRIVCEGDSYSFPVPGG